MSWAPGTSHLAVPGLLLKPSTFFIPASNHSLFLSFLLTTSALLVAYFLSSAAYALTLHPLARFPGPRLCAASRLPLWHACITGHQVQWMHSLHTRYGPVVRYGPNDLSFVDEGDSHAAGSAWKAIHGHEKGETEFPKAKEWFVTPENGTSISSPRSLCPFPVPVPCSRSDFTDIFRRIIGIYGINSAAPLHSHRRYRRLFRSAFSSSFLRAQEFRFQKHVSALLSVLTSAATTTIPSLAGGHTQGVPIDILELLNFTTFDIMGDLTLSQPLGLLASRAYTPWVSAVFASLRVIPLAQLIQHYPLLNALFRLVEPKAVKEMKYRHFRHSADRVDTRLAREGEDLNDIWSLILRSEGSDDALSLEEMYTHADVFMLAGSETTGTAMTGLMYLLLKNPEKMDKVKREVRGAFPDGVGELTMEKAAGKLVYLDACEFFSCFSSLFSVPCWFGLTP